MTDDTKQDGAPEGQSASKAMLGEHEKLCIFCVHWKLDTGSPGYSELTPGWNASVDCRKQHWTESSLDDFNDESDFREAMLRAKTCKDYQPPNK